jgi:hypothetical protein
MSILVEQARNPFALGEFYHEKLDFCQGATAEIEMLRKAVQAQSGLTIQALLCRRGDPRECRGSGVSNHQEE